MKRIMWFAVAALGVLPQLDAQTLAERIVASDGEVRFSYRTKPGVCSDGRGRITTGQEHSSDHGSCRPGPARMTLTVRDGRVVNADLAVGGTWGSEETATVLGAVAAPEAAEALLTVAHEATADAGDLVVGAALADSAIVWPELLSLARDRDADAEIGDDAVLWLGFAAGNALGPDTDQAEDDIRESAIFALSQRPHAEAVPALIRVVEGDHPVHLKKSALFWLGQTDDTRAVQVYEDILRGG